MAESSGRGINHHAIDGEGEVAKSDKHANSNTDDVDPPMVVLGDVELGGGNNLEPAPDVMCQEDDHGKLVENDVGSGLKHVKLQFVDIANGNLFNAGVLGPEEV